MEKEYNFNKRLSLCVFCDTHRKSSFGFNNRCVCYKCFDEFKPFIIKHHEVRRLDEVCDKIKDFVDNAEIP